MEVDEGQSEHAGDQELDLPTLRRHLADMCKHVNESQARVMATVQAKQAEFVAASDQVGGLRKEIETLRGGLSKAEPLLRAAQGGTDAPRPGSAESPAAGGAATPVVALRAVVAKHEELTTELSALQATTVVLSTVLETQRKFCILDKLTNTACYEDAARMILEIAAVLQSISAPDVSVEPAIVRDAKLLYYRKRATLAAKLEDALCQFVTCSDRCAISRRSTSASVSGTQHLADERLAPTTLPCVWEALRILEPDMRNRRIEQLADQAIRTLLSPLLDVARRLLPGCRLLPQVGADGRNSTVDEHVITWTWVEENSAEDGSVQEGWRAPVQAVLPALESLFRHARDYWAAGLLDVYGVLGKRLWPPVVRCLVQHFDIFGGDEGQTVEQFEAAMVAEGFITNKEKALSRHLHEHRHALGEQRRASVLDEERAWLLQDHATLVEVCDEREPGSMTQLLRKTRTPASGPQLGEGVLSDTLRGALKSDDGLLRLPTMKVSASARKVVQCIHGIMEEVMTAVAQERIEAAQDMNKLVREICTLFSVLRPYPQKGQLKTSARECGVFLTDCLYLVHMLLLIPYTYGGRIPEVHRQLVSFVDLAPQIRRLGENHFFAMLRHQQEQLVAALRPCDFTAAVARDSCFNAAEAALGAAVQQVKIAAHELSASLPTQLLREVVGLLLSSVCQNLLGKLFSLQQVDPDDIGCIAALLTSSLMMLRQVFPLVGITGDTSRDASNMALCIPRWDALTVAADLLGSDYRRFKEQRSALVKALRKEEAMKLMQLSWRDELLSPEFAWGQLSHGS